MSNIPDMASQRPAQSEVTSDLVEEFDLCLLRGAYPGWSCEQLHEEFNRRCPPEERKSWDEFIYLYNAVSAEYGLDANKVDADDVEVERPESNVHAVRECAWDLVNSWTVHDNRKLLEMHRTNRMNLQSKQHLIEASEKEFSHLGRHMRSILRQIKALQKIDMTVEIIDKITEEGFDHIPVGYEPMPMWMYEEDIKVLETARRGPFRYDRLDRRGQTAAYNQLVPKGRARTDQAFSGRLSKVMGGSRKIKTNEVYDAKIAELEQKIAAIKDRSAI